MIVYDEDWVNDESQHDQIHNNVQDTIGEMNKSDDDDENDGDQVEMNLHDTMGANADEQWDCALCTFTNNSMATRCLLCFNPRDSNVDPVNITPNEQEIKIDEESASDADNDNIEMNIHDTLREKSISNSKDPIECKQKESNEEMGIDQWQCPQCTFLNDSNHTRCEICEELKIPTGKLYNIDHEKALIDNVLEFVFNFDDSQCTKDIDDEKDESGLKTHYKMLGQTSFCMRGEMKFKYRNFMKYYDYLESGTDKQTVIGITDQDAVNCIIIDKDHQFIYHKPSVGVLSYVVSPRDVCFIRTRFKLLNYKHDDQYYDICGSLNYSIEEEHPYYVERNKGWIRSKIISRSFVLVQSKKTMEIMLYYVSICDLGGDIPKWLVSYNMGNRAFNINKQTSDVNLKSFVESWNHKMNCVDKKT